MSLRRFLGWEPSETRTIQHPDGTQTVITTTREVEWDDDTRDSARALYEDEADRCGSCGRPRSQCSDSDKAPAYPQRHVCWTTAFREQAMRQRGKVVEAQAKIGNPHVDDGETIWMSEHDLTPDDDFLTIPGIAPTPTKGG